jgi:hypothetical protein
MPAAAFLEDRMETQEECEARLLADARRRWLAGGLSLADFEEAAALAVAAPESERRLRVNAKPPIWTMELRG